MTPAPATHELIEAVRASLEGTPYVLRETPDGFDVSLDIENASWYAAFYKEHLELVWIYHVQVKDSDGKVIAITDDARSVSWKAGATVQDGTPTPVLGGSVSRSAGRTEVRSFKKVYAVGEDGHYGKVVDYSFNSAEGRTLIRNAASAHGWSEVRGTAEKIGLYVALGTLALLIVAGLAVLVGFLLTR